MVAGVCGGIAEYYGVDPTLVRLLTVLISMISGGAGLIAYIVMAIVVPEEPSQQRPEGEWAVTTPAPPVSDTPSAPGTPEGPDEVASAPPQAPPTSAVPAYTTPPPPQAYASPPQAYAPPPAPVALPAPAPPRPMRHARRSRGGGITIGIVLVLAGLALLANQLVPGIDLWRLWPIIIVAVGIRVMFRGDDD